MNKICFFTRKGVNQKVMTIWKKKKDTVTAIIRIKEIWNSL